MTDTTEKQTPPELLPCCGHGPTISVYKGFWTIECIICHIGVCGGSEDEARRNWNGRSALRAPHPAQPPAGWKLVPVEPTNEMLNAAFACDQTPAAEFQRYRAMLAASPSPPAADAT